MNRCEKCGLYFYGKDGEKRCGDCRRADNRQADHRLAISTEGNGEKKGFWRRWREKHFGAGRG